MALGSANLNLLPDERTWGRKRGTLPVAEACNLLEYRYWMFIRMYANLTYQVLTMNQSTPSPPLTRLAAQRLSKISTSPLRPEVRQKAAHCLIDYLGALVTGLSAPWATALHKYASTSSTNGDCHIIGLPTPVSAETAAFTNAAIAHSVIRDDMHLGSGSHIGVIVISAALAFAERGKWSSEKLLRAIVGGYEAAVMLGEAIRVQGKANPHFRPSGIVGAFGAAAAGIVGYGWEEKTAMSALSFAANSAAGVNEWPWAGGMEINTHMGTASRGGIVAVDLANAGMYSSDTVLEGRDGMFAAYGSGEIGARKFVQWLEQEELGAGILGVKFKPAAGCNFIQTPLSVALKLGSKVKGKLDKVRKITVTTTTLAKEYPGCYNFGPFETVQQTKMSIQYGVSAALLYSRIDEEAYCHFGDEVVTRLVEKCEVNTDSVYDQQIMRGFQPCRICIELEDGTTIDDELPDVPWLDGKAVEERFQLETTPFYGKDVVGKMLTACQGLAAAESGDKSPVELIFAKSSLNGSVK
jgi:2-methylcitrate dehydratase PrpD